MKSNQSQNKQKSYFGFLFKEHKSYFIFIVILYLGWAVLPSLIEFTRNIDLELLFSPVGALQTQLLNLEIFLAVITPYVTFHYVYEKNNMDMYFALPVSRTKLFTIQTLFTWFIVTVPALVLYLLSLVYIKVMSLNHGLDLLISLSDWLQTPLIILVTSIVYLGVSLFVVLATTSLFNGIIYGLALHTFPLLLLFFLSNYSGSYLGHTSLNPNSGMVDFPYLDPFRIFRALGVETKDGLDSTFINIFSPLGTVDIEAAKYDPYYALAWVLLGLLFIVLAGVIFKQRKVERTNYNYMVKGFYPVVIVVYGVLALSAVIHEVLGRLDLDINYGTWDGISSLFDQNTVGLVITFAVGLAIYFVVNMARVHGRPKFFVTFISYCLIFVLSFALTLLLHEEIVVKQSNALVDANEVSSVDVVVEQRKFSDRPAEKFDPEKEQYFENVGVVDSFEKINFDSKDKITAIINWQKDVKDNIIQTNEYSSGYRGTDSYKAKYFVKLYYYNLDGKIIQMREYGAEPKFASELEEITGRTFKTTTDYYEETEP